MEFLEKLYQRKEVYENELVMAKAKVCVINEIIDEFAVVPEPAEENQPETEINELAHIDETNF